MDGWWMVTYCSLISVKYAFSSPITTSGGRETPTGWVAVICVNMCTPMYPLLLYSLVCYSLPGKVHCCALFPTDHGQTHFPYKVSCKTVHRFHVPFLPPPIIIYRICPWLPIHRIATLGRCTAWCTMCTLIMPFHLQYHGISWVNRVATSAKSFIPMRVSITTLLTM